MNYFTLFPLQGYWAKFVGLAVSAIALTIMAIHELAGPAYLPLDLPPNKFLASSIWLFSLGLYMLSFSKEKVDDERVRQIRYTALRCLGYCCLVGPFCAFSPLVLDSNGVSQAAINDPVFLISILLIFPLLAYQVIFNIGLHFSPQWIFNDLGAEENIRKNPKFFLIYSILVAIIFAVFILFNK